MGRYQKEYSHLTRLMKELEIELPETMAGYEKIHRSHMVDGALTSKSKELMALGMSLVTKCEGCITMHMRHAISAGASRAEILEVISVAIMMGGGPVVICASQALEALDEFEKAPAISRLYNQ